jgi:hypothetical protein
MGWLSEMEAIVLFTICRGQERCRIIVLRSDGSAAAQHSARDAACDSSVVCHQSTHVYWIVAKKHVQPASLCGGAKMRCVPMG